MPDEEKQASVSAEQSKASEPVEQEKQQPKDESEVKPKRTLEEALDNAYEKVIKSKAEKEENKEPEKKEEPKQEAKEPKKDDIKTEVLEPRKTWSEEQKQFFSSLDTTGKKAVLKYYSDWDSGYKKKFSEADNDLKMAKELKETFAPFNQQLKQMGINPITKVKDLIALETAYAQDPERFIANLYTQALNSGRVKKENIAKMFGLDQTSKEGEDPQNDVASVLAQLENRLDQKLNSFEGRLRQDKVGELNAKIQKFFSQKNEDGTLKYPHFEKLENSMSEISQVTGEADLDILYNKALMLDPELSKEYIENQTQSKLTEFQKNADLEKAKKASVNLKNSPNANIEKKRKMTLDERIDENYDKIFK